MTPPTGYFAAMFIVGNVPKLKPHKIMLEIGAFAQNKTFYKS